MGRPVSVPVKLCLIGTLLAATAWAWAQAVSDYTINTINGIEGVGDGGLATSADLRFPSDVAVDSAGNLYIADSGNFRIRRVDPMGTITTIAGTGEAGFSGDGGLAVAAELGYLLAVSADDAGNVYIISETNDHRVRRVDPSGIITTVAGTGKAGFSGDGGRGGSAQLNGPRSVAADGAGNLYIADTGNNRVRRVDPSGIVTTIAGTGEPGFSGDGGPAAEAMLNGPTGVVVDDTGNLYVADWGNKSVRRVDASGTISTVADPSDSAGVSAVDRAGNLYFSVWPHLVRRMDPSGAIVTVAGTRFFHTWRGGFSGDGGPAVAAELHYPQGLAVDGVGNLYIADQENFRIRRVDTLGTITTVAGRWDRGFDGPERLNQPHDVAVGAAGNIYIADRGNNCIRRMDSSRIITAVAGTCSDGGGFGGDDGPSVAARLSLPSGVAVAGPGTLYIADTENQRIRRVDASGTITTVAGSGEYGYSGDNGPATQAQFKRPEGLAVDSAGNLYIADRENNRIRRVDPSGNITSVAGAGQPGFKGDGGPATEAHLDNPSDVAADSAGSLFVADRGNNRIRRVDPSGKITTIAGTGAGGHSGDGGPAAAADLNDPIGVAVDSLGNLYIANWNRIRRVDLSGTITTIAGIGERGHSGDGGPANLARLNAPSDMAVDGHGNIYIADSGNNRIRLLTPSSPPITLRAPTILTAMAVSSSRVKLTWQDNSTHERGFRMERRTQGSSDWVGIGTTSSNATTFLDEGLEPFTAYHYRVQGFNVGGVSVFSNETATRTLEALPPTLAGFAPTSGTAGAGVALRGSHLFEVTGVLFNGVPAARFKVVSRTGIEATVPLDATSGPISLIAPGGTTVSKRHFTVTDIGFYSRLFVPIVLRSRGRTPGSFFTSELTLTNRGSNTANVEYTYTASIGTGSGTSVDILGAGGQMVIPDLIDYLTRRGVPIEGDSAGGTLMVDFSNLSSPSDAAVTVRVSTPVEEGRGRAGLAFPGLNPDRLLTGPAFITGLRQNRRDRSNVAVQNAGVGGEESITLKVTIYSGHPEAPGSLMLPDLSLPPGGFHQYDRILTEAGFDNGYVKVERVEGAAPYFAYGVINDNFNSDGSFVFPVREDALVGKTRQTLPVIIERRDFASELTVTNVSSVPKTVDFRFVAEAVEADDDTARFNLKLEAGEQRILPQVVDWLRQQKVEGIGPAGQAFAGAVFAAVPEGDMNGIVVGARTSSPDGSGGQYGVYYFAVPYDSASIGNSWIYGLRQDSENRSNLALVNTGEVDGSASSFEIDVFELPECSYGCSGGVVPLVRTLRKTVDPLGWLQINGILLNWRQGYVQVRKVTGNNPFVTYGVINDGGAPGERSGDGTYLPSQ